MIELVERACLLDSNPHDPPAGSSNRLWPSFRIECGVEKIGMVVKFSLKSSSFSKCCGKTDEYMRGMRNFMITGNLTWPSRREIEESAGSPRGKHAYLEHMLETM